MLGNQQTQPQLIIKKPTSSASYNGQPLKKFSLLNISIFLTVLLFSIILSSSVLAEELTLAWDPNTEPDLDGYTVYYAIGSPGPPYDYVGDLPLDQIPDPNNPSVTLTDLDSRVNYYFALTAYDINGNESSFSSSLCIYIDGTVQMCEPASVVSNPVSSKGSGSGGCFIGTSRSGLSDASGSGASPIVFLIIVVLIIFSGSIAKKTGKTNLFSRVPVRPTSKTRNP